MLAMETAKSPTHGRQAAMGGVRSWRAGYDDADGGHIARAHSAVNACLPISH